jgi:hypothetical protein
MASLRLKPLLPCPPSSQVLGAFRLSYGRSTPEGLNCHQITSHLKCLAAATFGAQKAKFGPAIHTVQYVLGALRGGVHAATHSSALLLLHNDELLKDAATFSRPRGFSFICCDR